MSKNERTKKKLATFLLDEAIRTRIDEYCEDSQLSLAQFIRLAIIEKLERPKTITQEPVQTIDTSSIEYAINHLQQQQAKMTQMMEFLIDQQAKGDATQPDVITEAKRIFLEKQPQTYEEASQLVPDINTMNEAINQLMQEKNVQYKRRRLIWQQ